MPIHVEHEKLYIGIPPTPLVVALPALIIPEEVERGEQPAKRLPALVAVHLAASSESSLTHSPSGVRL